MTVWAQDWGWLRMIRMPDCPTTQSELGWTLVENTDWRRQQTEHGRHEYGGKYIRNMKELVNAISSFKEETGNPIAVNY